MTSTREPAAPHALVLVGPTVLAGRADSAGSAGSVGFPSSAGSDNRRAASASPGRLLWWAALGAAASVPDLALRGGKAIASAVERLADKGKPLADRQAAGLEAVGERLRRAAASTAALARDTVEYESRRLMERLHVATAADFRRLGAHLDALDRKLDEYSARTT